MEVLKEKKQTVSIPKKEKTKIENQTFEQMWQKSISGDEFVKRSHEHIEKLYALRDNQKADSSVY
ncbi:MAG: hypothetical protein LBE36_06085 [Flavobacteriaceae bacterium]|jgi:hypothetical protein|nr:hypothetical protein [Flavobacteriaceae bacterium]